ncbi:MAG: FAD-dependent oxidoreductase, partial [Candidatus Methanomethylophilaceae archaeon]|nr:FAD-dependent oxidoreductase [Candidatus Methanomethylophilaceae archaeon]
MDIDILVIGSGPAGVQAAIHASRKKAAVAVAGKPSSSAMYGTGIENYFGTGPRRGEDILSEGIRQAEAAGAVFLGSNVISASGTGPFVFGMDDGSEIRALSVIIATGISRRKLGIPGEKEFFGKGVSYCAVCDCNFYKGKKAVVVGNDSEAAVSAALMTSYAAETHWVTWNTEASDHL